MAFHKIAHWSHWLVAFILTGASAETKRNAEMKRKLLFGLKKSVFHWKRGRPDEYMTNCLYTSADLMPFIVCKCVYNKVNPLEATFSHIY